MEESVFALTEIILTILKTMGVETEGAKIGALVTMGAVLAVGIVMLTETKKDDKFLNIILRKKKE